MFDSISNEAKEFIFIVAVLFWLVTVAVGMIFAFVAMFNAKTVRGAVGACHCPGSASGVCGLGTQHLEEAEDGMMDLFVSKMR